jgi:hypothetical protein
MILRTTPSTYTNSRNSKNSIKTTSELPTINVVPVDDETQFTCTDEPFIVQSKSANCLTKKSSAIVIRDVKLHKVDDNQRLDEM